MVGFLLIASSLKNAGLGAETFIANFDLLSLIFTIYFCRRLWEGIKGGRVLPQDSGQEVTLRLQFLLRRRLH